VFGGVTAVRGFSSRPRGATSQRWREMYKAFYGVNARVREPRPRRPWDPRAVSDPGIVVEEFAGALVGRALS